MKPYYQDSAVTIYHGDCREIMERVSEIDLVLTDPPYGIKRDGKAVSTSSHGGTKGFKSYGWDSAPANISAMFDIYHFKKMIIWGGNYFKLPPSGSWLVWDKGQELDQADCELAWTNLKIPIRRLLLNRVALLKDGTQHPTQKPLQLMEWCLNLVPDAETIIDPYMGSGTTLRAAKDLGRKAIGIELEERYCEIAARRCAQECLPLGKHPVESWQPTEMLLDSKP
jgi:DNA modification methylase